MNKCHLNTELSSLEGTRSEFNRSTAAIKLGIDVHQDFYVVVKQEGGTHPKPAQRFQKEAFLHWALALVRVPTQAEEQKRAIHRQLEQLVKARKRLEAQGRSLIVNHGIEPVNKWWKRRTFAALQVPAWMKELLSNTQPILLALEEKIRALSAQLQEAAISRQPRGLGLLSSVVIDREIGNWDRFKNRRQVSSYTGLCPGEYSSGNTRVQSCVTKHGNPRLRAALVETAWRLVRFQPEYRAVKKWRHLLAKGALATGAARKKAIVAVARQLAVDLWRIRTGRVAIETLGLIN